MKKVRRLGKMLDALAAVSPSLAGRAGFRIFCTPRRIPFKEQDRHFLATASPFFFRSGKYRMSGYTWASEREDAPEVLCLHGWESNSARWRHFIRGMHAAGFTVHAFDAPASGGSGGKLLNVIRYSRAVSDLVARRGKPLYAMVGHSLGGAAAVMSTAMLQVPYPEKMVLLGVFAESKRVIEDFGKILGVGDTVLGGIAREIERRSGVPVEEYSIAKKAALLTDIEGFVLHDRDDEVAPVAEGRRIAESWQARYLETKGLGHRMQDPAVVREVVKFLRTPKTG